MKTATNGQSTPKAKTFYSFIKRVADIVLSFVFLLVCLPIYLVTAIIVKSDGGPAIFKQIRVGKGGKDFVIYKFRSMCVNADEKIERSLSEEDFKKFKLEYKLDGDPRVTKVGKFIRKTSIDELPQFWCIFKGDMSFVGPRPVPRDELLANYTQEQIDQIVSVKPGLTGYWQAYSRNESSYASHQRQDQELYYVNNISFWLDVKIVIKTFGRVFSGKGAS